MEKSKKTNVETSGEKKPEKLTYEQLEQVANNLNKQCQQMYGQLQEANRVISEFNEIDMLLSILGKSEFFNDGFISRCSGKIEEIITKALDKSEEKTEEKN